MPRPTSRPTCCRPAGPLGEREDRDERKASRQHRGPPHERGRYRRGPRDGVGHQAAERTLPQLPHEQAPDEVGLGGRRPAEQVAQDLLARRRRTGPGRRRDALERAVDVEDRERGHGRVRDVEPEGGCPAHPDATLARFAGQEAGGRLDLVGREPAQQVGQRGDLRRACARRGDGLRGRDQVGEQHVVSVPERSPRE
jgi:hypothetical protein